MKPTVFKLNGDWWVIWKDVHGKNTHARFISWGWAIAAAIKLAEVYPVCKHKDTESHTSEKESLT